MVIGNDHRLANVEGAGGIEQRKAASDIGTLLLTGHAGAERARRHQEFGRDILRPQQTKAVLLE